MTKKISSYNDLLKEKQRLELLLEAQKQVIYYDVQEIKQELRPVRNAIAFIKKLTTRDTTNVLLTIGSDIAINTLVKKFILSRSGWIVRTVVPYFLKNFSSHVLAEQKDKWIEKLKSWLGHKNGQGDEKARQEEDLAES